MNAIEEADRIAAKAWDRDPDSTTLLGLSACLFVWGCMTWWLEVLDFMEERLRS